MNHANLLLEKLPHKDRNRILEHCESVNMVFGDVLGEPGKPFRNVYFPCAGFISLLATVGGHPPLEMGMIGNEGMFGATLVLGVNTTPLQAVVQGAGSAWRMTAPQFRSALRDSQVLSRSLNRYLYVLTVQLSQTSACTHFHEVKERLARWLLMTHDRAHADQFHLTHKFLAEMLGVQRSAITIAAGILQQKKLIRYNRGEISILNRGGLEAVSCECYNTVQEAYTQLFA